MTKRVLMLCGALLGASAFKDLWTKFHKAKPQVVEVKVKEKEQGQESSLIQE